MRRFTPPITNAVIPIPKSTTVIPSKMPQIPTGTEVVTAGQVYADVHEVRLSRFRFDEDNGRRPLEREDWESPAFLQEVVDGIGDVAYELRSGDDDMKSLRNVLLGLAASTVSWIEAIDQSVELEEIELDLPDEFDDPPGKVAATTNDEGDG